MKRRCDLLGVPALLGLSLALLGAAAAVPASMLGSWAHGSCQIPADRLVITSDTATLGTGKPAKIYYDASSGARNAIHWSQEYVVDNFMYVKALNAIVHNTQGFGMPGAVVYKKCPR